MSDVETKMDLATAERYARRVVELLAPYCDRIEIAGSIRRRKAEVGDIEIVCIPSTVEVDVGLFGEKETRRDPGWVQQVNQWKRVKGDAATGKYTQRILPGKRKVKLDLFTATPDNWGLIFALRTGSHRFSHIELASRWSRQGYKSIDGYLHYIEGPTHNPRRIPLPTERDLFDLLGLEWVHPRNRV